MPTCEETRTGFTFNNPDINNDYHAPNWGLLVTADELRYDELFGNQLIAEADSQSITDDQLLDYARLAIGYLERELNIDILPRRIRYEDPIGEDGTAEARTDFNDTTWSTASFTTCGAMIYNTSNSNSACAVLSFGGDQTVSTGDFQIQFPAAGASTAIIRIA